MKGINLKERSFDSSTKQQTPPNPVVFSSFKLKKPLPKVPKKLMIYKTINPEISLEEIRSLMKAFGLQGEIIDNQKQFIIRDRDKVLEVFKQPGTGYIRFSNDKKLGIEKLAHNLPSEGTAVRKALRFLKTKVLLPENSFVSGIGYFEFIKRDTHGEIIEQGKSALAVRFGFKIEEMRIEGPGAKADVVFGDKGEIIEASKIWREIEEDKAIKIVTPEEAFTKFKQRWPEEAEPEQLKRADIRTEVNAVSYTHLTLPTTPYV